MYPQIHIRRTVAISTMLALLAGGGLQISQALASPHVLGPADRTGSSVVTPPDRADRVGAAALPAVVALSPDRADRVGAAPLPTVVALSPDRADALGTNRFETVPTPAVVVRSETHTSFGWASAAFGAAIASLILVAGFFVMRAARPRGTAAGTA